MDFASLPQHTQRLAQDAMNKAQHLATLLSKVGNTIHCIESEGVRLRVQIWGFMHGLGFTA